MRLRNRERVSTAASGWLPSGATYVFNPLDLSPTVWLDAADATTITESSGSVSQWNDKSGNGYNVTQGTGANQPTTGTRTQNGLNVIDFDGTTDGMSSAASIAQFRTSQAVTIMSVIKCDRTNAASEGIVGARSGNFDFNTGFVQERRTTFLAWTVGRGVTTSANADYNARRFSNSSTSTLIYTTNISAAANSVAAYVNDTVQSLSTFDGTMVSSNFLSAGSGNHRIDIGARFLPGLGQPLDGFIAEVVVFDKLLSSDYFTKMLTYLNTKWSVY